MHKWSLTKACFTYNKTIKTPSTCVKTCSHLQTFCCRDALHPHACREDTQWGTFDYLMCILCGQRHCSSMTSIKFTLQLEILKTSKNHSSKPHTYQNIHLTFWLAMWIWTSSLKLMWQIMNNFQHPFTTQSLCCKETTHVKQQCFSCNIVANTSIKANVINCGGLSLSVDFVSKLYLHYFVP